MGRILKTVMCQNFGKKPYDYRKKKFDKLCQSVVVNQIALEI